jgi:2-succinyl-5-enolpyruvyl-6-hydroxy-3-cyclohexene-1-carboxylate synthase
MPIRDVESFGPSRPGHPRVLANRGANGIDGVVSTAWGVALATDGPVVALVGDLAFLHDVSALVRPATGPAGYGPAAAPGGRARTPSCTLVVADNGGGGIFSFLPPATLIEPQTFEALFGTPQAPDVAAVAAGFGLPVDDLRGADGVDSLGSALRHRMASPGMSVIRVPLPGRGVNVTVHDAINRAAVRAVDALME